MAAVVSAAARQVAASVAGNGGPWPWSGGTLANERIAGFTKMMYAITMNVVRPAITSVPTVVRCSRSLKTASSIAAPPSVRALARRARARRTPPRGGRGGPPGPGRRPAGAHGGPGGGGGEGRGGGQGGGGAHRRAGDCPGPEECLDGLDQGEGGMGRQRLVHLLGLDDRGDVGAEDPAGPQRPAGRLDQPPRLREIEEHAVDPALLDPGVDVLQPHRQGHVGTEPGLDVPAGPPGALPAGLVGDG